MLRALTLACLVVLATGAFAEELTPSQPQLPALSSESQHPLMPIIKFATRRLGEIDTQIQDYTCTLTKRVRIDGKLLPHDTMQLKLRHEQRQGDTVQVPFSVYVHYLSPDTVKDREAVFVRGRFGDKAVGRNGGDRFAYVTTLVDPNSDLAMQRNHYPMTEIGIRNLILRLLEVGHEELQHDPAEIEVKYFEKAKIGSRVCTAVQITHLKKRDYYRYHVARIFIDDQLVLPVHFSSYDWPTQPGERPPLIEEYTYTDVKLNVGLSDWDFDYRNPDYQFRKDFLPEEP